MIKKDYLKVEGALIKANINHGINCIEIEGKLGKRLIKFLGDDIYFCDKQVFIKSETSLKVFLSILKDGFLGVNRGYFLELVVKGLGYRFLNIRGSLFLKIGFSHYIKYNLPVSVKVISSKSRLIILSMSLEEIRRVALGIMSLKKKDVYKGKGIRFVDSDIILKVGKKR